MITLAFAATAINYLDRQTLSVAAPVLREQFHMTNVEYSRVLFGFLLAYTIMNGVSGPMIDRLGTRLGYALCIAWWSAAAFLHAFARGAGSLFIFRFLLGAGEAGNWPAAVKVVAEWFPEEERALACGIFNSGSAVGAILAPPLVAWIILTWGWPAAFAAVVMRRFPLADFLVANLPHTRGQIRAGRCRGHPGEGSAADPIRQRVHDRENLFRFGLVLLYFLVSGISEECAPFRPGRHRQILVDSVCGRRSGELRGRSVVRIPAAAGTLGNHGAQIGDHILYGADDGCHSGGAGGKEAWQSIALVSVAMFGYTGALAIYAGHARGRFPRRRRLHRYTASPAWVPASAG